MRQSRRVLLAVVCAAFLSAVPAGAQERGFQQIDAGLNHVCGVDETGRIRCWGDGEYGQMGRNLRADSPIPRPVNGMRFRTQALSGGASSCGVQLGPRTRIQCWGDNTDGQLGDGTTTQRIAPVPVEGARQRYGGVTMGEGHACARTINGRVSCWGNNANGQLGDGTTTNRLTPTPMAGGFRAADVQAGFLFTCGLNSRGVALCWGYNGFGALGDGTADPSSSPVRVNGLRPGVQALAVGSLHSCVIDRNGNAACWGDNSVGQIGNGQTGGPVRQATRVPGLQPTVIAAGGGHSCAVVEGGDVMCWGLNAHGQLGDGTTMDSAAPVRVAGLPDPSSDAIVRLTLGDEFSCALTALGRAYCWGENADGQLGNGTFDDSASPVRVRYGF